LIRDLFSERGELAQPGGKVLSHVGVHWRDSRGEEVSAVGLRSFTRRRGETSHRPFGPNRKRTGIIARRLERVRHQRVDR